MFYGDTIFSIELPQFLEIMVVKTEGAALPERRKKAYWKQGPRSMFHYLSKAAM